MCQSLVFGSYGDEAGSLEEEHLDLMTSLENINPQIMKVLNYHRKKTAAPLDREVREETVQSWYSVA